MFSLAASDDRTFEWYPGMSTFGAWAANVNPWIAWHKSQVSGCNFIDVLLIGAGGGGGGGFTKGVGAAGGGGAGGGSGGYVRARFPLFLLPETVYFYIPQGGQGGVAGASGSIGGISAMMARPALANPTLAETFLVSSALSTVAATGGGSGAPGVGGAAATIATSSNCGLSYLAISVAWTAGQPGVNGGSHLGAAGTSQSFNSMLSGGAGGAGSTSAAFTGGSVPASVWFTAASGSVAPLAGDSGISHIRNPFFPLSSDGGAGGGSTNTAATAGGAGGNGGFGNGGGGGGAGVSTGGRGGDGGDGYLLLVAS